MKILCPTDFSETSVNAIFWAAQLADIEKDQLTIAHFVHYKRRAGMLISLEDDIVSQALDDINLMKTELTKLYPDLIISIDIYRSHPKDGVITIAEKDKYDLIILGTSGLDALNDMTIGSLTEHIFDHTTIPVIAIPPDAGTTPLSHIGLAIDDVYLKKTKPLFNVRKMVKRTGATLHLIQIVSPNKEDEDTTYDFAINEICKDLPVVHHKFISDQSVATALRSYCEQQKIDLLGLIHHKRSWWHKLYKSSTTKNMLFQINTPLMILTDG